MATSVLSSFRLLTNTSTPAYPGVVCADLLTRSLHQDLLLLPPCYIYIQHGRAVARYLQTICIIM